MKIDGKVDHPMYNKAHEFQGQKVIRPIDDEIKLCHIFRTEWGRPTDLKLGTPVSPTSAMTFKVKGQGLKITSSVSQVLAHKSRTKSPRNT